MRIIKEEYDPMFDEDLQKYIGKPLKELLKDLNGKLRVNYQIGNGTDIYGTSGGMMRINQIPWHLADAEIRYVKHPEDTRFYDIDLVLIV